MPLFAALQNAEDERRITAAQTVLWLACVGPLIVLAFVSMEIVFGHPASLARFGAGAIALVIAGGWLALYAVAGYLIGERRAIGGLLGIALFARTLLFAALQGRVLTLNVAYAVVGIALIVRAGKCSGYRSSHEGGAKR